MGLAVAESPKVRVFNNTPNLKWWLVSEEDGGEVNLEPGHWVQVKESVVIRELLRDTQLIFDWGNNKIEGNVWLPLPYLTIATQIDIVTGYGNMACHLIPPLAEKFDAQLYPLMYWRREGTPQNIIDLMDKQKMGFTDWTLAMTIPPEVDQLRSPNVVLLSMWETANLPEGWAEKVNTTKHVIVPCQAQKEVFESSGVTVPISVVPLGVNTDVYHYKERPQRNGEPFTILLYGALSSRKSPIETIMHVCWKAFRDVDDWRLILKTRWGMVGGGQFSPKVKDHHVDIMTGDYEPHEMAELCYEADCGIFLSKYEGFGLPPREMMSTGLPVIWTAAHGHLEDCYKGVSIDIPVKHLVPASGPYEGLGGWVMPDWDAAALALRYEYEDWKYRGRTQSSLGRKASKYIGDTRTWKHTADGIIKVIGECST